MVLLANKAYASVYMSTLFRFDINKPLHQQFFSAGVAILFIFALYQYSSELIGLITYTTSDWLINYQGGLVRRGFIGQLIYSLTNTRSNTLLLLFSLQITIALVTLFLILRVFFSTEKTTPWLLFLLSPAFFISYFLYDTHSALRKENLVFLAMAILVNGLLGKTIKTPYLFAALTIYSIAVLSHEIASFCLPFFLYPLYIFRRNNGYPPILLKIGLSFCVVSVLGLILAILFKGNSLIVEKICASLLQRGLEEALCGYSIPFLASNTVEAYTYVLTQVSKRPYIPLYFICLLLSAIPFLLSSWVRLRSTQLLLVIGVVSFVPLFLTGIDWGRWIYVFVVLVTLCLFWYATQKPIQLSKISPWIVFIFVSAWTLPAIVAKSDGILGPQMNFLPNLGLIDVMYRQFSKEPKADPIENALKPLLTKYKKIIYYPLEKNSPPQHHLSLLAIKNGISINTSLANAIGTSRFLNFYSNQFIEMENQKNESDLNEGHIDPQTLYIFQKKSLNLPMLISTLRPNHDVLFSVGDNLVLAPSWKTCTTYLPKGIANSYDLGALSTISKNKPISFAASSQGKNILLANGWYDFSEDWGTWSVAPQAKLILPVPQGNPKTINLQMRAFVLGAPGYQFIQATVNGVLQEPLRLKNFENNSITINLPPNMATQKFLVIDFDIPNLRSPFNLGVGDDRRLLGIGMKSALFE